MSSPSDPALETGLSPTWEKVLRSPETLPETSFQFKTLAGVLASCPAHVSKGSCSGQNFPVFVHS